MHPRRITTYAAASTLLALCTAAPPAAGQARSGPLQGDTTAPAAADREQSVWRLREDLLKGENSPSDLLKWIDALQAGPVPTRASTRSALSEALSRCLRDRAVSADRAGRLAGALVAGLTAPGPPEPSSPIVTDLVATLAELGANEEQTQSAVDALLGLLGEQQPHGVQELAAAFADLKGAGRGAGKQRQALARRLRAVAADPAKPSDQSLRRLGDDLSAALDRADVFETDRLVLAREIRAVLNSAGAVREDLLVSVNAVRRVLTAGGVDAARTAAVVAEIEAIYASLNADAERLSG